MLNKKILNLANEITILRLLLIPFFIAFVLYSRLKLALFVFVLAAISDGVDGYIARATKQRTELGKILDPIADKLLILSALICLSIANEAAPLVKPPLYVPIIIISRDALIVLGVLIVYLIKGEINPKPTLISKITTFFQMLTIVSVLLALPFSPLLWNTAVLLTIWSGIDYLIKGTRILNER